MRIIERKIRKIWLKLPKICVKTCRLEKHKLLVYKRITCFCSKDYCKKHMRDCDGEQFVLFLRVLWLRLFFYSTRYHYLCDKRIEGHLQPQMVELDRKDLLSLIAGTSPSRIMMEVIKDNTGMGHMKHDCKLPDEFWKWNCKQMDDSVKFGEYSSSQRFDNRELLELYIAIRTDNIDKAIEITKRDE